MTIEEKTAPPVVRRNYRPSFAEDVYGGATTTTTSNSTSSSSSSSSTTTTTSTNNTTSSSSFSTNDGSSGSSSNAPLAPKRDNNMCESSLAQRRCANLPKLKEIAPDVKPSMDYSSKVEMSDIDFNYADEDSYETELAELYSYSEMEDWAIGLESFYKYTDNRNFPQKFKSMEVNEKKRFIADIIEMLESTESSIRLEAARLVLYLLQGAFGDFRTSDEEENEVNIDELNFQHDKGTGGYEHDCLLNGAINAYFCYQQGLYPALCTMLLYEIQEPFDVNFCADRSRSRQSSMSNSSRSASNVDLADTSSLERRTKRSATLADNESIRMVLSSIYHMLEAIRHEIWIDEISENSHFSIDELLNLRKRFLAELEEPLDIAKVPLLVVLFDMMPSFARGQNPHYPMRKILLLIWKIILTTLGGFEELKAEKNKQRKELNLPIMEDTIEVGGQMKAIRVSCDGDYFNYPGVKSRLSHPPRSISRQLACSSGDGSKEEDEPPKAPPLNRQRGGGSSDNDDGADGLPDMEGNDDEVLEDKKVLTKDDVPNAKAEESSPPPDNSQGGDSTPVIARMRPRFAGNIPYQEFHGRGGDLTPKAGSPRKSTLPWSPKVSESQAEAFIQQAREKFLGYTIPGDLTSTFALPPTIDLSLEAFHRHMYKSLSEIQIANDDKYNRFPFTQKEKITNTPTERLYVALLPQIGDYLVALLKMLLAALPSSKSRGDALSILSDVLTPETDNNEMLSNSINLDASTRNVLEEHVRVALDIARHKEVIVKSISGILIILFKWLKINHIYQYESVGQHLIMLNCVPLMLKFLDQNMVRYIQAKNELAPFNYPSAPLFFARNREEWPTLSAENVDDSDHDSQSYYIWRNVFSSINVVRLLNKITKGRQPRTMMLVVFKSAPILKRCLRVKCGLFQLYCLKLLKLQCRFLGRQWRKSNMDLMSAIYMRVRHRLNDDWAYANDTRNKQWDYQNEEKDLKLAVEKFHSRRYAKLYPQFKLDMQEITSTSKDYFDLTSMEDFEPVDNCLQSVLNTETIFSERFKRYYEKWLKDEVFRKSIDWDNLLENSQGISTRLEKEEGLTSDILPSMGLNLEQPVDPRERISTIIAR
uniref:Uncharacterized protein n=1 Tax=Panagrolaimus sp. PS1159 TaxID=55785 RepID=A0AC35G057_9BILA